MTPTTAPDRCFEALQATARRIFGRLEQGTIIVGETWPSGRVEKLEEAKYCYVRRSDIRTAAPHCATPENQAASGRSRERLAEQSLVFISIAMVGV
jgi:hypothetical protein